MESAGNISSLDERVHRFLDLLNTGFLYMDMEFGIIDVNETGLKWLGYTREEVIGQHASRFFDPEDFKRLQQIDRDFWLVQQMQYYQFEFDIPDRTGQKHPFIISISVELNSQSEPHSSYILLTNIEEQKIIQENYRLALHQLRENSTALEREKKLIETVLLSVGDYVSVFDPGGSIILSNTPVIAPIPALSGILFNEGSEEIEDRSLVFDIDGIRKTFSASLKPVYDDKNQVFAYVEIIRETTDQEKLREQEKELVHLRRSLRQKDMASRLISVSKAMDKVQDLIVRCAEVDSSVLIIGETGVGKEIAAREICAQSRRSNQPFVAVNCNAIPETLLESELFGHEKGAYTGAYESRLGLFREAEGGTIFLDEIGDLNSSLQIKLLRVLQEKEVRPVGGKKSYAVDVRIIAATHRNLGDLVRSGIFRSDLYYRLAVIPIIIPPLRERPEDILPLADHFIKKHWDKTISPPHLSRSAQMLLLEYHWPGNIRELENFIQHALVMQKGSEIDSSDFPARENHAFPSFNQKNVAPIPLEDIDPFAIDGYHSLRQWELEEMKIIRGILDKCKGNKSQTARELGISRSTLWRKMKTYRIW